MRTAHRHFFIRRAPSAVVGTSLARVSLHLLRSFFGPVLPVFSPLPGSNSDSLVCFHGRDDPTSHGGTSQRVRLRYSAFFQLLVCRQSLRRNPRCCHSFAFHRSPWF